MPLKITEEEEEDIHRVNEETVDVGLEEEILDDGNLIGFSKSAEIVDIDDFLERDSDKEQKRKGGSSKSKSESTKPKVKSDFAILDDLFE
jgi:hypothetical protein